MEGNQAKHIRHVNSHHTNAKRFSAAPEIAIHQKTTNSSTPFTCPRRVYELWVKYKIGIGGRKLARNFI